MGDDGEQELTPDIQIANIFYEAEGQPATQTHTARATSAHSALHITSRHSLLLPFNPCVLCGCVRLGARASQDSTDEVP